MACCGLLSPLPLSFTQLMMGNPRPFALKYAATF